MTVLPIYDLNLQMVANVWEPLTQITAVLTMKHCAINIILLFFWEVTCSKQDVAGHVRQAVANPEDWKGLNSHYYS